MKFRYGRAENGLCFAVRFFLGVSFRNACCGESKEGITRSGKSGSSDNSADGENDLGI